MRVFNCVNKQKLAAGAAAVPFWGVSLRFPRACSSRGPRAPVVALRRPSARAPRPTRKKEEEEEEAEEEEKTRPRGPKFPPPGLEPGSLG